MENILLWSWLVLALAGIAIWLGGKVRLQSFLSYLTLVLILLFALPGFEQASSGQKLTATLIAVVSVNWILAQLLQQKWRIYLGLVSALVFVFWKNSSLAFFEYPLVFDAKNALFLPLAGAAFPLLIGFKSGFLSKFFGVKEELMYRNLQLIGLGILLLAALFFAGIYGLVLVGVGYFTSEVYRNKDFQGGTLALLLTAFAFILVKKYAISTEAFLHASTLAGLFVGLGIGLWIKSSERLEVSAFYKKILYFLIPVLLVISFVQLETVKEHLGGVSALSAIIIALALSSQFIQEQVQRFYLAVTAATITLALLLTPQFQAEKSGEQKVLNDKFSLLTQEAEPEEVVVNDTISVTPKKDSIPSEKPLEGKWKIVSEVSSLDFELGPPETRTKGYFKTLNGAFVFDAVTSKSSVKIDLPLSGFSTNNDMRDESLLETDFLDAAQSPVLRFESQKWTQNKKKITVTGDFTMRGVKQKLVVQLKIVAIGKDKKGDYVLVTGASALDRTKFGMESDPKIGDVVDFEFKLELRK